MLLLVLFLLGDPQEEVQVPRVYCHRWPVSGSDTHGGKVSHTRLTVLNSWIYISSDVDRWEVGPSHREAEDPYVGFSLSFPDLSASTSLHRCLAPCP